jgi:lipopolysaccharide/colanic/teichoic acid biosynthesis glycosyltransferase
VEANVLKYKFKESRETFSQKMGPFKSSIYTIQQNVITPLWKRTFDIIVATTLIILLLPVFLMIIILQQMESPGSVFYAGKRVGAGYKIFHFYKFRTMQVGADKRIHDLAKDYNQYENDGRRHLFVKIKNDPRVTNFGRVLRRSGFDELPQLFNVLKGDMSIVGNRPIPVYEAEMLLEEKFYERFYAPGGITGLWQVSKRGKENVSESERIDLDNQYVKNMNLLTDIKILFKTPFAMISEVSA